MKIEVPTMNGYLFDRYGKFVPADQKLKASLAALFLFLFLTCPKMQKL